MASVKVIYRESGRPASQVRVGLGIWDGVYPAQYTDANGDAHFATASPGEAEIYVDGKVAFKGRVSGSNIVHI